MMNYWARFVNGSAHQIICWHHKEFGSKWFKSKEQETIIDIDLMRVGPYISYMAIGIMNYLSHRSTFWSPRHWLSRQLLRILQSKTCK